MLVLRPLKCCFIIYNTERKWWVRGAGEGEGDRYAQILLFIPNNQNKVKQYETQYFWKSILYFPLLKTLMFLEKFEKRFPTLEFIVNEVNRIKKTVGEGREARAGRRE